jgi:hypothetical protein
VKVEVNGYNKENSQLIYYNVRSFTVAIVSDQNVVVGGELLKADR